MRGRDRTERDRERALQRFVWTLLAAVLIGIVVRAHYAFIFLPVHHGESGETDRGIIDVEGWWAYLRSPVGAALHVLWLGSILVVARPWLLGRCGPSVGSSPLTRP